MIGHHIPTLSRRLLNRHDQYSKNPVSQNKENGTLTICERWMVRSNMVAGWITLQLNSILTLGWDVLHHLFCNGLFIIVDRDLWGGIHRGIGLGVGHLSYLIVIRLRVWVKIIRMNFIYMVNCPFRKSPGSWSRSTWYPPLVGLRSQTTFCEEGPSRCPP